MPLSDASNSLLPPGSLQGTGNRAFPSPGSTNVRKVPLLSSRSSQNDYAGQSDTSDGSAAASGQHRGGHVGSVSGDSDSDLYSEGESEDNDNPAERPVSMALPAFQPNRFRDSAHGNSSGLDAKRANGSPKSMPVSYFNSSKVSSLSLRYEIDCYVWLLRYVYKKIEADRLPWMTDFADMEKMELPRKAKEIAGRLNLNIPYYFSNYLEIFYVVTMPLLLVYNIPFFVVTFLTVVLIHSIRMRKKSTCVYGDGVVVLGRSIGYRKLGHLLLLALAVLFLFFHGLRTLLWVLLLNFCVIVPHALMRKPTYFDDEDLEKCRPKLGQYAICLAILVLAYLEGDACDDEEAENRRAVERERRRLAQVLAKREAKEQH
ncbi:hypothetical protein LSCM4_02470 [Leishmania orientalis]|uniref:PRA1 family protein n=1 Tax=Leishmania orientalis TaxID=2249476 RepID=A0A836GBJ7_9TRYP|nr:hypothetical protein LSCM4_02470 [Leishmania orientalis]